MEKEQSGEVLDYDDHLYALYIMHTQQTDEISFDLSHILEENQILKEEIELQ